MSMNNKICIIVGAGFGLGLSVARRFVKEGFQVILLARRTEALQRYVAGLSQTGAVAAGFQADAADLASLKYAFDLIKAQWGAPEVLVYNAAVMTSVQPSTLEVERLIADFKVNVVGALFCAQQVIPDMRARRRGTILLTGGGLALDPNPQYASLAIGKAGLRSLCYSLGAELEPDGIHVAIVTIAGFMQTGTHFDPDQIAEVYWQLHSQPPGKQEREIVYK